MSLAENKIAKNIYLWVCKDSKLKASELEPWTANILQENLILSQIN